MDRQAILRELREQAGLRGTSAAERAFWATWSALASCIAPEQRSRLIAHLPSDMHDGLNEIGYVPRQSADSIYNRVAAVAHIPLARATELTQVALRAIVGELDEAVRDVLTIDLPVELAELLRETKTFARPTVERTQNARSEEGSTLASGRPGSSRPISESPGTEAQHGSEADWSEARMRHTLGSARDDDE